MVKIPNEQCAFDIAFSTIINKSEPVSVLIVDPIRNRLTGSYHNNIQGSIWETRTGPNRPKTRRGMVFVDFKYIFYENRYSWPI